MKAGGQTVIFVTVNEGAKDDWGIPASDPVEQAVGDVRFRPLSTAEEIALADSASEVWKLTVIRPVPDVVLNASPASRLRYDGKMFELYGSPRVYTDHKGAVFKVTVLYRRQQVEIA